MIGADRASGRTPGGHRLVEPRGLPLRDPTTAVTETSGGSVSVLIVAVTFFGRLQFGLQLGDSLFSLPRPIESNGRPSLCLLRSFDPIYVR
jgi:hypothetical protein